MPSEKKGWSQVVKDLLAVGLNKQFNLRAAGYDEHTRGYKSPPPSAALAKLDGTGLIKNYDGKATTNFDAIRMFASKMGVSHSSTVDRMGGDEHGMSLMIAVTDEREARE